TSAPTQAATPHPLPQQRRDNHHHGKTAVGVQDRRDLLPDGAAATAMLVDQDALEAVIADTGQPHRGAAGEDQRDHVERAPGPGPRQRPRPGPVGPGQDQQPRTQQQQRQVAHHASRAAAASSSRRRATAASRAEASAKALVSAIVSPSSRSASTSPAGCTSRSAPAASKRRLSRPAALGSA